MMGARNLRKDGTMKVDPSSEWTGGGLVTNPTMLVMFYGALTEGRIVKPESLATMLESRVAEPRDAGLALRLRIVRVRRRGRHSDTPACGTGYRTHVTHYAVSKTTIAVQTNRDGRLDMGGLVTRIASSLEP